MSDGDIHVWKPGAATPEAECGYAPEVIEHEADEETASVAWQEIVHAEPTGQVCEECRALTTPEQVTDPVPEPEPEEVEA